jgi:transposase-like protein
MARNRGREGNGREASEANGGGASVELRLEHLRRTFAKFRRAHRPRTRIPPELREEALEALRSGVAEPDVRRACGVTPEQLQWWWQRRKPGASLAAPDERAVRVFPVVDEEPEAGASEAREHATGRASQQLELRIGGWAICIRQVEA